MRRGVWTQLQTFEARFTLPSFGRLFSFGRTNCSRVTALLRAIFERLDKR